MILRVKYQSKLNQTTNNQSNNCYEKQAKHIIRKN